MTERTSIKKGIRKSIKRVLSGIQPSGRLHLGNYLGAIRQYVDLQAKGHECFYFIANYHALTSLQDKAALEAATLHVATAYLALGIDPDRSVFFMQSDVPEVTELCWLLNTVCPVSLMQKATSYKDKVAHGEAANMGLFDYPVLQAADIVIYDSNLVPVGQDQKQHIEITRDLAIKFNQAFGRDVLVLPEPYIVPEVAVVPGIDGEKMSKSYDNAIEIFQTPRQTQKRCAQIVTDSTALDAPKDPDKCSVYALLKLLADDVEAEEIAGSYRAGGYGYGHAKARLAELINELFAPARDRYAELEKDPDTVRDILRTGGAKARLVAQETIARARDSAGILTSRSVASG
ncbi:MAG: tryptophan--tRNA ligase [Planctomycetes bacterium]|nr:tryptophan--tRNA ligase [Planctomycetota bacterium]